MLQDLFKNLYSYIRTIQYCPDTDRICNKNVRHPSYRLSRELITNILLIGTKFEEAGSEPRVFAMQVLKKGQFSGNVTDINGEEGVIASITAYDRDRFNSALHYHDNAHISFVLDGACVEKKRSSYDRTPGRITYYSAREPHEVISILRPSKHINLEIDPVFFAQNEISDVAMDTAITTNPDAKFLMINVYKELVAGDAFSSPSIQMLLLDLVHSTKKMQIGQCMPRWMMTVRTYLLDCWDEQVSLQKLSAVAGVHPVNISKYFRLYFGCTLGEYMRKVKIEKALALIKTPGVSLSGVAYECGFADQSHFIRNFKHFTGYLPKAYQKLH